MGWFPSFTKTFPASPPSYVKTHLTPAFWAFRSTFPEFFSNIWWCKTFLFLSPEQFSKSLGAHPDPVLYFLFSDFLPVFPFFFKKGFGEGPLSPFFFIFHNDNPANTHSTLAPGFYFFL